MYTLELAKAPLESDGSSVWGWLQFLRSRSGEEFEMIAEKNPEIKKAVDTLYELSSDEEVRYLYETRLKAWRDRASQFDGYYREGEEHGLQKGMQKGIQEGRKEGKQESREEIARNALSKGLSIELIRDITGLDIETINNLATNQNLNQT